MSGTALFKEPAACTGSERREFERLVLEAFDADAGALGGRIRDARCLAFHYDPDDTLTAIAALKAPGERYRSDVFEESDARASAADYELELGWVFVVPDRRGRRIAGGLCRGLLERVPGAGVFATTRTDNAVMARMLVSLGFARAGRPYRRRDEDLAVFLRPRPAVGEPGPAGS